MITYTKMFEKIGVLPFQTQHYIEKIDWDNAPTFNRTRFTTHTQNGHKTIKMHELDDNFARNIKHYCEEDLKLKIYQANLTMVPAGGSTPMHTDIYQYIQKVNNLNIDKKDCHKVFVKYWIPLSDKTSGQYFEYNGIMIEDWKANDVYRLFGSSIFDHRGGNEGSEKRIRLEITGAQISVEKINECMI